MGSRTKKILENAKKINEENSACQSNLEYTTVDIENAEIVFEEDLNLAINQTVVDALNQVLSQPENDLHQVFNDLEKNQNGILNASGLFEDLEQPFPVVMACSSFQNNSTSNNVDINTRQNHHSHSENEKEYNIPDTNIESSDESDNINNGEDIQSNNENDEEYIPDSNTESGDESDDDDIQPNNKNVEPEVTETDENVEENLQKRKRGKTNQRQLNKRLRMQGEGYLGFRKPRNQRKTFNDTKRAKRRLKPRCDCGDEKNSLRKCKLIAENDRAA